jgi:L-ascorbate metabolism protein UlaG (beta-lactamase superfamily)
MKIQHIRNACMIIHFDDQRILVDPCLNPRGSLPPYTVFRQSPRLNPTVDLPQNAGAALDKITCGLITHFRFGHFDHLDRSGIRLMARKQVPVYCNDRDASNLKRRGIHAIPLKMHFRDNFISGHITPFPTMHGYGLIGKFMGRGAGYFIEPASDKTIYISGDTVMTQTVRHVLDDLRPDISILNAGVATLDIGRPILMPPDEQMEFIRRAPGMVIAAHLDAFNHCLTNRDMLRAAVLKEGLSQKVLIPQDGELLEL